MATENMGLWARPPSAQAQVVDDSQDEAERHYWNSVPDEFRPARFRQPQPRPWQQWQSQSEQPAQSQAAQREPAAAEQSEWTDWSWQQRSQHHQSGGSGWQQWPRDRTQ